MRSQYITTWTAPFVSPRLTLKPIDSHAPSPAPAYAPLRTLAVANQPRGPDPSFPYPNPSFENSDQILLSLLRQRKTEEAWIIYSQSTRLPSSTCLSRLLCQLSYQNTPTSFARSQSIITRLRNHNQLHLLDANSLGLLAVSAAKFNQLSYAASLVKSMLRSGYLPHVKAWTAVVGRLASSPGDGPLQAVKLFNSVVSRISRIPNRSLVSESLPDTAAFNNVLNACASTGDKETFLKLFDEMPEYKCHPDVLTYNILIKLCARCERIDLLPFVLERIVEENIQLCSTTFQSLVAAYVGSGDLETAENLVQALREGRKDLCEILRKTSSEEEEDDEVFRKLLPERGELRHLPKVYPPNTRIYTTLMKGYMKRGRLADTARMLEAMRKQETTSHPDNVSYTTLVSAFVKSGEIEKARDVVAEMRKRNVPVNRVTCNILVKGYCQQLQMENARKVLEEMGDVGADVVTYNTLIDGCIRVDDSAGALAYFNEMRERGISPTTVSYTTLMKAFVSTGQPKLAHKVFDEMGRDPRLKVDRIAWNMLIDGYCKAGMVEEAKKAVEKMKETGFHPDVATYGSLANGIAAARKPGEALLLWREVKGRCGHGEEAQGPPLRPDMELLDTLADVCLRAAFFQKALEIVACMEENGLRPDKTKYKKIYVEMHSKMYTSKHASQARQDRRRERKRAAEAFKFWLGLPNSYYDTQW